MKKIPILLLILLSQLAASQDRVITTLGDSVALQKGDSLLLLANQRYLRWDKDDTFKRGPFTYSRTVLSFNQREGCVTDISVYKWIPQRRIVSFEDGQAILQSPDTAVYRDGYVLFVHGESLYFSSIENAIKKEVGILGKLNRWQLLELHEKGSVRDTIIHKATYDTLAMTARGETFNVAKNAGSYTYDSSCQSTESQIDLERVLNIAVWGFVLWIIILCFKKKYRWSRGASRITAFIPALSVLTAYLSLRPEIDHMRTAFGDEGLFITSFCQFVFYITLAAAFVIPLVTESIITKND